MQLHIQNKIKLDGQIDLVEQSYPVRLTEKKGYIYLTYTNEEEETVILKCNEYELVMTRYSNPKSTLRFHRDNPALVVLPTPVGIQELQTQTSVYELDAKRQHLKMHYQLKQVDSEGVFADYQMKLRWG